MKNVELDFMNTDFFQLQTAEQAIVPAKKNATIFWPALTEQFQV